MNRNGIIVIVVIILILLIAIIGYASYSSPENYEVNNQNNEYVNPNGTGPIGGGTVNVTSSTTVTTTPAPVTKSFTVNGANFSFSPSTLTVNKGDRVKITFVNTSGTHDLKIEGYNVGTAVINGGQSQTFEFTADKAGTFEYYCSVGTHRQMGMRGNLIVK